MPSRAALFPTLTAQRPGPAAARLAGLAGPVGSGGVMYGVTTASLNVSYSPDVFGGVRRQVESTGGAGRGPALPARGDVSLAHLQRRGRGDQSRLAAGADRRHPGHHPHPREFAHRGAPPVRPGRRLARRRAGAGSDADADPRHPAAAAEAARSAAQPAHAPGRPIAGPGSRRELRARQAQAAAGAAA